MSYQTQLGNELLSILTGFTLLIIITLLLTTIIIQSIILINNTINFIPNYNHQVFTILIKNISWAK